MSGVGKCWGYLLLFVGGFSWLPVGHFCPRGPVMSFPELFYRPRDCVEAPGVTLKVLWLHSYSPFLLSTWCANRAQMFKHYTRKLLSLDLVKNFSHPIESGCFWVFTKQWPQPPKMQVLSKSRNGERKVSGKRRRLLRPPENKLGFAWVEWGEGRTLISRGKSLKE